MRTATRGKLKTVTQRRKARKRKKAQKRKKARKRKKAQCAQKRKGRRLRSARLGSGRWEHCQLQGGMTAVCALQCATLQRSTAAQRRICTQSYK